MKSISARVVILPYPFADGACGSVICVDGEPISSRLTKGEAMNAVLILWSLKQSQFDERMN